MIRASLLYAVLFGLVSQSAAAADVGILNCITEFNIPKFLPTFMGFSPGAGRVHLTIGDQGQVLKLEFDQSNKATNVKLLNLELEMIVTRMIRYSARCAGSTLSLRVDYVIVPGPLEIKPVATVRLLPPDRLVIEFPRMKPIIDHAPPPK